MNTKTRIQTLCLLALTAFFSDASHAFNKITVHVRVNSSSTFSGSWDEWWGKPDQFVVFYGEGNSAQSPACKSNPVIDIIFVGPPAPADWSCDFTVNRPGRLYIGLYDGDGPNSNNTAGQQIDIAPGAAKAVTVNLESLVSSPNTPFTFTSSGDDGTINYTVSAAINPGFLQGFATTSSSFTPSAGEQIVLTGSATGAPYTFLRVNAFNSSGTNVWSIFGYLDNPGQSSKTFVWQGRDPIGNPLPPGAYTVKFTGFDVTTNQPAFGPANGTGAMVPGGFYSQTINILPPPVLPSLGVLDTTPAQQWAPDVGDLTIRVVSSGTATVTGEVYAGTSCAGTKLLNLPPVAVTPSYPGALVWTGPVFTGGAFPLGQYRIKVIGTANGGPTNPAFVCQPIEMIAAAPATLYMQHAPFLAEPGQTVEITANAVDSAGAPRIAGRLDVFGTVQPVPGAPPAAPTSPLRSCTMASSCTATISLPAGGSFFSFRSTATDRTTTVADSGWRGQRVMPSAGFAALTNFALPIDVALNGPFMANARSDASSMDLVFSVSTDFDWNNTADRQSIGTALDRFMSRLWGIQGNGAPAPTTFLKRPDLVRLYVVPERNVVSWNPNADLCDWTVPGVAWADATAILHKTECRDNAYTSSRSFSAKLLARDVIFHELHHALYGLADEYPSGDGGYFEAAPFPNVYNDVTNCMAQVGREPGGCTPIVEININNQMPTGRTFFRLDASASDVMVGNGTQRFGDIRQANWKEGVCDSSGC